MEGYGNENPGAFQPTRPLRGATVRNGLFIKFFQISTHAPLAGRDKNVSPNQSIIEVFQPTRPLRGATGNILRGVLRSRNFNPRAPCGARHQLHADVSVHCHFNPRAPCGARPSKYPCMHRDKYFNPRAPCGARLTQSKLSDLQAEFQPTRPLRGATHAEHARRLMVVISTHAPLAGRDISGKKRAPHRWYFNPRAPCGARRV